MSRIIAQVVVAGATVLFRAATQAWGQALINAQKSGVAQESAKTVGKVAGQMTVQEAQMILEVPQGAGWGEVVKRYKHLFEVNEKSGSFYLQSKVYRAKERLEQEYPPEERAAVDQPKQELEDSAGAARREQQQQQQQQQQGPQ